MQKRLATFAVAGILLLTPVWLLSEELILSRYVQPWNHFTVVGRQAFFVGKETGEIEAWVLPFKIFHGAYFQARTSREPLWLDLRQYARQIYVRPWETSIRFVHPLFTVEATYFAPLSAPILAILLKISSSDTLFLRWTFQTDLQPMWPAGLGGQYTYWDSQQKAFVLSESRRHYAALVGSPLARTGIKTPAHALPSAPVQMDLMPVPPGEKTIPILVAASGSGLKPAQMRYRTADDSLRFWRQKSRLFYQRLENDFTSVSFSDKWASRAFEWAKVSLVQGFMNNPDLGFGLVAGFGPSGRSARPGFAWFFGGDACINLWALNAIGTLDLNRRALEFLVRYQRKDGKIAHEITQSAAMIPWFEEYPYPYYHADTTPYFLIACADYLRYSGDLDFLTKNWSAILRAYRYCLSADANADGLMDNLRAGLGAAELGTLRKATTEVDIYLASVWLKALESLDYLAKLKNTPAVRDSVRQILKKAKSTFLRRFWDPGRENFYFSLLTDGTGVADQTCWQAVPLALRLVPDGYGLPVLKKLMAPDMVTNHGTRFLSANNPHYDPLGYNNGAVWPFVTLFSIQAAYTYHQPDLGEKLWASVASLTFTQQLGAISEVFSGDRPTALETAVPHQLFSSTPVIVGPVRGMLGYRPNVPEKELHLVLHIPAAFDSASWLRLPYGRQKIDIAVHKTEDNLLVHLQKRGTDPLTLRLEAAFQKSEKIEQITLNGKPVPTKKVTTPSDRHLTIRHRWKNSWLQIRFSGTLKKSPSRLLIRPPDGLIFCPGSR